MKMFSKVLVALFFITLFIPTTRAAQECNLLEQQYEPISLWDVNVDTLMTAMTNGVANAGLSIALGDNMDNLCTCVETDTGCPAGFTDASSDEANSQKVRGSLAGIVTIFERGVKQPLPLDTGYAWNKTIEKVPFARTALAAPEDYSGPLLGFVYDIWLFVRDIAFAIMAIVMLIVGIMLITQKKVGQASVTLQLALPRIAIALVLISFSYVIGAVGASLAYNLGFSVESFVKGIDISSSSNAGSETLATSDISAVGLLIIYIVLVSAAISNFLTIVIVLAILAIVVLATYLLAYIEFVKVYAKMLMSIIAAPISFSLGAIPGNEAATTNWFKTFAAYLITLPAMNFVIHITWVLGVHMIDELKAVGLTSSSSLADVGGLIGGLLGYLVFPVILIFGYSFARTIPEKVQTAIVGAPKGGKK